jgi:hypothetical protein
MGRSETKGSMACNNSEVQRGQYPDRTDLAFGRGSSEALASKAMEIQHEKS